MLLTKKNTANGYRELQGFTEKLCTMGISLTDDRDRLQQMQVIFQIISVSFVVKTFALYVLFIQ